ncbi:hypothetical protein 1 [Beihai sobemo-like virus 6]|uniref:hypothetical protein 1 n=1 Tax=Beihai sobemo-like virus 6 TaxID=1922703 RepID=UPI00090A0678|nr:hypothetical protein 1 [Beihai sobemo-like virus 6]APG75716.1 hypothetical protein 1 [Beihai sobemo-like virus 6]
MAICDSVSACAFTAFIWGPFAAVTFFLGLLFKIAGSFVSFLDAITEGPLKVYAALLLAVVTSGGAAYLYYRMRILSRVVLLDVAEEPVGPYRGSFGRLFFRQSPGDKVFEAVPEAMVMSSSGELGTAQVTYKLQPLGGDGDESTLAYSSPPRVALKLPPFMFEIGLMTGDGMMTILGIGFRAGDYLVTARHLFHSRNKVGFGARSCFIRRGPISVEVQLTNPIFTNGKSNEFESMSWMDICAYLVPPGEWAALGARSLRTTELSSEGDGTVEVYGRPGAQLMVSSGQLVNDVKMEVERGVLSHTASTVGTFSGSPLVMMQGGAYKLVGMHIAGGVDVNYAVSAGGVRRMLKALDFGPRSRAGVVWDALRPQFHNESKEERRKQMEPKYSLWDEEEMRARQDQEDCERELMAEVKDYHAAKLHGQGHLDWKIGKRQQRTEKKDAAASSKERWADMMDDSIEESPSRTFTDEELELAERLYERLSQMKREKAKGVYNGWIDKSYVQGYCFLSKTKTYKALFVLSRINRIQLWSWKDRSWIAMEELLSHLPSVQEEDQGQEDREEETEGAEQQEADAQEQPPSDSAQHESPPGLKRSDSIAAAVWHNSAPLRYEEHSLSKPGLIGNLGAPRAAPRSDHPPHSFPFATGGEKFWADRRSQCRRPLEPRDLNPQIEGDMEDWMTKGDWNSWRRLKNVGAKTLLQMPQMQEYRQIMRAGNVRIWKDKKTRSSNVAYNANGAAHAYRIGTCEASRGRPREAKHVSEDFVDALQDLWYEGFEEPGSLAKKVSGYALPPSGPDAVKASFIGQCGRQKPGNWDKLRETPNFHTQVNRFYKEYTPSDPCTRSSIQDSIDHYLDNMDGAKSAGWSSRVRAGTKGVWSRNEDARCVLTYCVMARLALRIAEGDNIHWLKAEDMVSLGLKDPVEIFTKTEAHDEKKVKDERWRLIWVVSMIDSVCQDIAHRHQNKTDIYAYAAGKLNCQAVGLGHHDNGVKRIGEMLEEISKKYPRWGTAGQVAYDDFQSSDASGWDLSVSRDAIYFDAERRIALSTRACPAYNDLLWAEAACNSAHVVVIGTAMWTFEWFGITASGIPSTSAQNSSIRSFTAQACGATKQTAAGDDLVHTGSLDIELLASTGCLTKEGSERSSGPEGPVEFTSHVFKKVDGVWTATFNNLVKMLAHLDLRRPDGEAPSSDMVSGMRFALRHTPLADRVFCQVCDRMGWSVSQPVDVAWE